VRNLTSDNRRQYKYMIDSSQADRMHAPRKWYFGLLTLLCACVCRADGFGGDAGAASDEVFRGLTQSDNQLSPQLDLHYSLLGWYAGVSGVGVRRGPGDSISAGVIAYAGYQQRFSDDWSGSLALRHYEYPGNQLRRSYDYEEGALTVSWRDLLIATVMASPNVFFADFQGHYGRGAAYAGELTGRLPLPHGFCANAGLGYYDLNHQIGTGYAYGSAGVSKQWRSWNFDVRYVATDETARHRFEQFAENRVVVSALWLF
jgi:uncharacterized protein (TIGR02001 family)